MCPDIFSIVNLFKSISRAVIKEIAGKVKNGIGDEGFIAKQNQLLGRYDL